jgi:Zn-dependent protease
VISSYTTPFFDRRKTMRIFRLFGVPVYLDYTFPLWAGLLIGAMYVAKGSVLEGFFLELVVFLSLLCHEFAHVLVAQYYGTPTQRVVFGMGGMLAYLGTPTRAVTPWQECRVAAAGPLVSLGLALVFMILYKVTPVGLVSAAAKVIYYLNLLYAFLNLIPAFPLDGGRILHACLLQKFDKKHAVHIAFRIAQLLLVVMLVIVLVWQVYGLIIFGVVVLIHSRRELRLAEM